MPIPKPRTGETEREFMERCLDFLEREDPNGDNDQHIAICLDAWKRKNEDSADSGVLIDGFGRWV